MGMSAGVGNKAVPYINVTPLIDVLLVLLIIFMVVTPLKPKRFQTLIPEPPRDSASDATASKLTLRVDILREGGRLQLNEEDIGTVNNTSALSAKLASVLQERERMGVRNPLTNELEKTVFIKAPESLPYGEVVKVIDAVKGAGAKPVGLQVDSLQP
jgi:biopolymer transport protein TolR